MANMVHLNGHRLCVLDVETTGLNPKIHDIIEFCAIELDSNCEPVGQPCQLYLQPEHPETAEPQALKVNKITLVEAMKRGIDPMKAMDVFCDWFEKMNLKPKKKIAPLGHVYQFDRGFILEWLGEKIYNLMFDYHVRDTAIIANYMNDRAYFRNEKQPFPKQNLQYLCNELNVINPRPHSALGDCVATAECYRKMLRSGPLLG